MLPRIIICYALARVPFAVGQDGADEHPLTKMLETSPEWMKNQREASPVASKMMERVNPTAKKMMQKMMASRMGGKTGHRMKEQGGMAGMAGMGNMASMEDAKISAMHGGMVAKGTKTLKDLCAKLQMAQTLGKVDLIKDEPWFENAMGECGKFQKMGIAQITKERFHTLTDAAVDEQCEQLDMAKEAGREKLMQGKAWYKHLEAMCSAMREHHPVIAMREAAAMLHQSKDGLKKLDGTSVAMGCTSIFQAQHNGKVEWFEKQKWYRKALAMCNSMHGQTNDELKTKVQETASAAAVMFDTEPAALMREGCTKFHKMQESGRFPGRMKKKRPLIHAATKMCSMIGGKSTEEIRQFVHAQDGEAESSGGLALANTCKKLHGERGDRDHEWTTHLSLMCQKLNRKKMAMDPEKLMKRCKWLHSMEEKGMVEIIKDKPWFSHLSQVCAKLAPKLGAPQKRNGQSYQESLHSKDNILV